jgi:hypothetical protein
MKIILKIILNIAIYWNSSDSGDILSCKLISPDLHLLVHLFFKQLFVYKHFLKLGPSKKNCALAISHGYFYSRYL